MWLVAWPMVAIGLLKTSYFLTDAWFVGMLGDDALSALGGTAFAWWMILLAGELAGTGTHALVAQHVGARRPEEIRRTLLQGLWLGVAVSVALLPCLPVRWLYFDMLGFQAGTAEHAMGMEYLAVCLWTAAGFSAHAVVGAVFRGLGDTKTDLRITAATLVLNAVLDPLLIWGVGPIPALGIGGAAWATAISRSVGAVIGAWVLFRRGHRPLPEAPDLDRIRQIARIGTPVSARGVAFCLVYVALGRFITAFGSEQMAALGVGHRLESLAYMVCVGFEVAAATMVGQHIGAGDARGARRAAATAALLCCGATVPMSVVLYLWAEPLFTVFASEPSTIAAGAAYLRIQVLVFVFMALEAIYEGAFSGSGHTMPAFWIGAVGTTARLPAAWLLAWPLGLGVDGIWWAIAGSTAIKGVWMLWAFHRGDWLEQVARVEP